MFAKLLLPVDFSPRSPGAAATARYLAAHCGGEVTLLHVVDPSRKLEPPAPENSLPVLENMLSGVPRKTVELTGDPAAQILEYARHYQPDLIVMPTHGYGVLRRFLLGSVTAKVLHDSEFPVWTGVHASVPADGQTFQGVSHVACAVDLGPPSEHVLRWSAQFATAFGAKLTVIHASPQLVPVVGVVHEIEWRRHVLEALEQQMAELLERSGVVADVRLAAGAAPEAVTAKAEEVGADVLAIGRSPHGLLGRLRTVSYALIRHSPVPVVSV
jgi:nucleotide-binding universal stress UspA family protein